MKCLVCGDKPVYHYRDFGFSLCRKHFIEWFEKKVFETIKRFKLIRPGELVAVAVSGGKDSLTTLYLLNRFSEKLDFKVIGLAVDEGIKGYREYKLDALRNFANKIGVELVITSFKEYFNATLDEMVHTLKEKRMEYKPCTICGVFRRYLINLKAREIGASKVATGHNLDDEVQVFLMNMLRAGLRNIAREGIITGLHEHPKLVPRIKPLYFCREKEVLAYSILSGIETPFVECSYVVYAFRDKVRRWINKVESLNPGIKLNLLALKELISNLLRNSKYGEGVIGTCQICGEPSSGNICKTCFFIDYLGLETSMVLRKEI
ncbi:MAG: TIGR00269 family protein [Thermoprotei archaeon]|nr:MAG: TIGR00269 family protein [Thermoprotei archaeon]